MPYIVVENFAAGLDSRRHPMMAPVGSLRNCINAHITRGGEVSKRRAFEPWVSVPGLTKGLAVAKNQLFTFGSDPAPTMPALVNYQRLVHPTGIPLQKILSWDTYDGKLYVVARFQDGSVWHYYDGVLVTDWYDGRARASFDVVEPTTVLDASSGVLNIKVNGIDVLGEQVTWPGSAEDMAQAIVDQVNAFGTTPEYEAARNGRTVIVMASDAGAAANGRSMVTTTFGSLTIVPPGAVGLAGGVDTTAFPPGNYVKTVQTKMYATASSLLQFSGIEQPTKWTTATTGAGFINMANQDGQSQQLMAMERYYSRLAIFARHAVQIWTIDVDPAKNVQNQTLRNTGLLAPLSVEQVGDNDVFYLSDSGVRSLRARDSSTAAAVNDIGTPVDELIVQRISDLGPARVYDAVSVIEPVAGRYWLALGDRFYVFTQFPGSKVAAWSTYEPGFVPDAVVVINNQVALRSGSTIYRYGGIESSLYDASKCTVDLPLLAMEKPAHFKKFSGIDMVIEGEWHVYAGAEPLNLDALEMIGTFNQPTLSMQRVTWEAQGTHANIRLVSDNPSAARLASLMVHYELADVG